MHSFHDTISSFLHFSPHSLLYFFVFNNSCPFNMSYSIIIIMIGHRNIFIQDVDLSESTSLTHLLNRHTREDDEDVETQMIKHSPFCGQKQFADLINNNTGLSIIDLNIQNIFARFDELVCFIETINDDHTVSAICLNECWLSDEHDLSVLHLEGYNMYFQRENRVGHGLCGLIVYIHETFLARKLLLRTLICLGITCVYSYRTVHKLAKIYTM